MSNTSRLRRRSDRGHVSGGATVIVSLAASEGRPDDLVWDCCGHVARGCGHVGY